MTQPLQIKTYFSSTVEAAVSLARKELGQDAMLMNSRRAPADVQHLGQYEVVFATSQVPPREAAGPAAKARDLEPAAVATPIEVDASVGRTVALVGPPGSGKTSTLVKLAIRYGIATRTPVRLFSAHDFRVGAAAQLRSYATVLGVSLQCCESLPLLEQALDFPSGAKTLTLIDTPGYGRSDMGKALDLARCLTSREIDVHLVLRSEARTAEMLNIVERFRIFRPAKLIFTALDEAETHEHLHSVAHRAGKPVSFLCSGQQVPEDLEPATAGRFAGFVETEGRGKSKVAA